MPDPQPNPPTLSLPASAVPGRMVAEILESRNIPYTVIETNPATVTRACKPGRRLVCGDASDAQVLEQAGVKTATLPCDRHPQ